MQSNHKYLQKNALEGTDRQVLLIVAVVGILCLLFVLFHPYYKPKAEASKVPATTNSKVAPLHSSSNQVEDTAQTINTNVVEDNASNVSASANTSSPQPSATSNTSSAGEGSAVSLQASQTTGDPDSFNISVPKTTPVPLVNKLTNDLHKK